MSILLYLIPAALFLGLLGLGAFIWAVRSGQYEDLDGAAGRILFDDPPPGPPPTKRREA
jgi:cbb3-type cytochrome oxidase maturation protein